ncbi:MAG: EamA family transporter [Oceanospirillum sp.]|nr:EamA family transporter [Oceanospirillum sp.]
MIASQKYYHSLMIFATVLVASSFPVGAAIAGSLSPSVIMLLRFVCAAILFLPYVMFKKTLALPSGKRLLHYSLISLPLATFFWCMFESLKYTSALNTSALYTMVPGITALYMLLVNRETTGKARTLGLMLGTLGAIWIVFRGDYQAAMALDFNYGDLVFFIGCLVMAGYNFLVKKLYAGEPMELMTFWVLVSGAGWLLLASWGQIFTIEWQSIGNEVYLWILYLSFFSTLVTFFLQQMGIVKIGATNAVAYSFLTPAFALLLSILFGIGVFELAVLPGIVLVIVAMFIIQRT